MKINNNKKQGFSLVETIIYLAIVGILLTATISLHLTLGGISDKLSSNISVSRNRRVALGAIDYLVKNSDGLLKDVLGDCSSFGSTPASLALYFEDDSNLPGICVENGGGVRISINDKKILATCYPNMSGNGYYQNCDTSVYPVGNAYYLTSSDVAVLNSSLNFSTSTASSTANSFVSLTTNLSVGTHSNNQIRLRATSTATSTTVIRNAVASGLVSWYKFDDVSGAAAIDSVGDNDLVCSGTPTVSAGLINDSSGSFDFNAAESDYCRADNQDDFNFSTAMTVAAWIKMDYTTDFQAKIFDKADYGSSRGYLLMVYYTGGRVIFRICDTAACTNILDQSSLISDATVYHVASVYDLDADTATLYIYQKAVGGVNTTTVSSLPILVNYEASTYPRVGSSFDGQIDELRIYNRALSAEEIWALQSQGAS